MPDTPHTSIAADMDFSTSPAPAPTAALRPVAGIFHPCVFAQHSCCAQARLNLAGDCELSGDCTFLREADCHSSPFCSNRDCDGAFRPASESHRDGTSPDEIGLHISDIADATPISSSSPLVPATAFDTLNLDGVFLDHGAAIEIRAAATDEVLSVISDYGAAEPDTGAGAEHDVVSGMRLELSAALENVRRQHAAAIAPDESEGAIARAFTYSQPDPASERDAPPKPAHRGGSFLTDVKKAATAVFQAALPILGWIACAATLVGVGFAIQSTLFAPPTPRLAPSVSDAPGTHSPSPQAIDAIKAFESQQRALAIAKMTPIGPPPPYDHVEMKRPDVAVENSASIYKSSAQEKLYYPIGGVGLPVQRGQGAVSLPQPIYTAPVPVVPQFPPPYADPVPAAVEKALTSLRSECGSWLRRAGNQGSNLAGNPYHDPFDLAAPLHDLGLVSPFVSTPGSASFAAWACGIVRDSGSASEWLTIRGFLYGSIVAQLLVILWIIYKLLSLFACAVSTSVRYAILKARFDREKGRPSFE